MFSENCPICNRKLQPDRNHYKNKFYCFFSNENRYFHIYSIIFRDGQIESIMYRFDFGCLSIEEQSMEDFGIPYKIYIWNSVQIQSYNVYTPEANKLLSNPENAIKKLALLS